MLLFTRRTTSLPRSNYECVVCVCVEMEVGDRKTQQSYTAGTTITIDKVETPEVQHMVMCMTNNKVSHCIINSQFPDRFSYCSTILKIEGVRLHPLNITFFTNCLKIRQIIFRSKISSLDSHGLMFEYEN